MQVKLNSKNNFYVYASSKKLRENMNGCTFADRAAIYAKYNAKCTT